jgi:hypothetical protein
MRRAAAAMLALLLLTGVLAACGGGGESSSTVSEKRLDPVVVKRANAVCREFERELVAIAEGALANPPHTVLELTTQRLVKPVIPVLERTAARLRALRAQGTSPSFDLFVNLFDPGIVLAEKRVTAGEEGSIARSRGLEKQLTNLSETQRRAAANAGLADCSIDFSHVLLSSISE